MAKTRRLKAILEAQDKASPVLRGVGRAMSALSAIAVAAGASAIGRKLVDGLQAAVMASAEYEGAATRLGVALRNQGEDTRENRKDLLNFAAGLTKVSLATETQILSAVSQAKALGASNEATKDLIRAATDLAAATGVDMETAFRQSIRTLGGYAGELGEIIPELKDLTAEQLKAGEAADILLQKFGGAGAAGANTLQGALNNTNSAIEQLQRAVGGPLTVAFKEALNTAIIPFIENLTKFVNESPSFTAAILDISHGVVTLAEGMVKAASAIAKGLALLAIMRKFVQDDVSVEIIASIIELSAALDGLDDSIDELQAKLKLFKEVGLPDFTEPTENVKGYKEEVETISGALITQSEAVSRFVSQGTAVLKAQMATAMQQTERLGKTIQRTFRTQGVTAVGAFSNAIVDAAVTGQANWRKFFGELLQQLAQAIVKALLFRAIMTGLGIAGFGGGGGGGGGASSFGFAGFQRGGIVGAQRGMLVPGFDTGRDSVPILARPGEAVLPRELTDFLLRAAGGGGGGGGPMVIEVRTDLPATVNAISNDVQAGRLTLKASGLATARSTR